MPVLRTPPNLTEFAFDGRVAVRQGETRHHVNISWRHDPSGDQVLLTTPLGQGVAELSRDAAGARLVTADRREFSAADWERLGEQLFGIRLPLNDLPAWIVGHAIASGNDWRVEYLDYQSGAPDALPTLLEVRRGDIEVRLKIDDWSRVR